jgi:hypothetical protein
MSEMRARTVKVERFYELLKAGFSVADVTGTCQFRVHGAEPARFYVEVSAESISCGMGDHANPTTTVMMPDSLFASIIARPHLWDLRNPEVVAGVSVAGDVGMALFLGKIAKTPARAGVAVFAEAERKARAHAPTAGDVERLGRPTRADVLDRLDRGIPFFLTGQLQEVGAWSWPFERIKSQFSSLPLDADQGTKARRTLGEFFAQVESGRQTYTHGIALPAPMRPYFPFPLFPDHAFNTPLLWMGRKNGVSGAEPCTSLHRDTSHGFLAQIKGAKRIVMCSPDQAEKLYPERTYNVFQSCHIRLWQPDYVRFPLSRDLRTIELTLRPTEVLVIPAGWFHEVYCNEPVMSIGTFMNWSYWQSQFAATPRP